MLAYFNTSLTLMSLYNKVRRQVSEAGLSAADRQYLEFSNLYSSLWFASIYGKGYWFSICYNSFKFP